ncbi:MAG: hypothetical protein ACKOQY_10480 [Bacteroidota bacterium]
MTNSKTSDPVKNPYLFIPANLQTRIAAELSEKNRLMRKRGYLSRYNYAIRLMFLDYLDKGMDVRQDKIHPAFRHFIAETLGYGYPKANSIIQARHRLKYKGEPAPSEMLIQLCSIIKIVSDKSGKLEHVAWETHELQGDESSGNCTRAPPFKPQALRVDRPFNPEGKCSPDLSGEGCCVKSKKSAEAIGVRPTFQYIRLL